MLACRRGCRTVHMLDLAIASEEDVLAGAAASWQTAVDLVVAHAVLRESGSCAPSGHVSIGAWH